MQRIPAGAALLQVQTEHALLDELLQHWREPLDGDFVAYRHHCFRVFNFCSALARLSPAQADKLAIAVAFHDLGIWTHHSFDYLEPSQQLAREYLAQHARSEWTDEVLAMIAHHHQCTPWRGAASSLVECFRKADWIDVSLGSLSFGLPRSFIRETRSAFPNAGFHQRLLDLSWRRLRSHPLSPLPMMKW